MPRHVKQFRPRNLHNVELIPSPPVTVGVKIEISDPAAKASVLAGQPSFDDCIQVPPGLVDTRALDLNARDA